MDEKIKLVVELSNEFISPCSTYKIKNTYKIKKLGRESFS